MEDLELLKNDWNNNATTFKEYSEKEIYLMIKRKSVSLSRTLLLIGLVEITIWAVYGFFNGEFSIPRISLFIIYVVLTIWFYEKMKMGQDAVTLMKSILNLRKLIFSYAIISLSLIITDNIIHFDEYTRDFMAGNNDAIQHNDYMTTSSDEMVPTIVNYLIFGALLIFFIYIIYSIYKITYGKILRRLKKNYRELSDIHES